MNSKIMEEKKVELLENEELTYLRAWDLNVIQKKNGYRFSLDSLLLAGLADLRGFKRVIDLGAGSGVLSLIIAKRFSGVRITAVEVQDEFVDMMRRSVILNGLDDRISAMKASFGELKNLFSSSVFDAVISNPPYWPSSFAKNKNMPNSEIIARYEVLTDIYEFVYVSSYLLKNRGKLFVIYPSQRLVTFVEALRRYGLEPKRLRFVHPCRHKKSEFVYVECVKGGKESVVVDPPLFVYSDSKKNLYSKEVAEIIGVKGELVDQEG
ncbi:MAG: tRNA1(Val) (adenine(37)-N6)-methyltransferase [Thermosulfidibacteraceae bacterium]